jgi:DNA-binding LacI/PurR family transcriptional regulator
VVGFDDLPGRQLGRTPLTTILQPLFQMAVTAARRVLMLARGEKPSQTRVELATELVVRESTAPPRQVGL